MNKPNKTPWPTKEAMQQVYANKLWGTGTAAYYSGEGSHHPGTVQTYQEAVISFFKTLESPPVVCDLGCGDFNVGKELVPHTHAYKAVDIVPELIAYNKANYKNKRLTFHTLDIAKDPLPKGDCALLRQVLQHLSNAEIAAIVEKLYAFKYVILTEHLPDQEFVPNKDIISGQGTRLKKQSGVDLVAPPFNFRPKEIKKLLIHPAPGHKGQLLTTLYQVF